jgi:hypothetical protein
VPVHWDDPDDEEGNTFHITREHGGRGITIEDVEHVIATGERLETTTGHDFYMGRVPGHELPMLVKAYGVDEIYPVRAHWISERRWRIYRDRA